MVWTRDLPILTEAWYWFRVKDNSTARPIHITKDGQYEQDGRTIHPSLFKGGEWSHRPIPFPEESQ